MIKWSLQDVVNNAVDFQKEEKREINSWHCSKLGSCLTGVYLERLGVKPDEEFDNRTLRVFSAGKMFEQWVVDLAKKSNNVKLEEQVRVEDKDLNFSGYADLVIDIDGQKILYEIKSKNSRAFWYMEKQGEGANHHHLMQTWLYLYGLGIEEGRIFYIEKDSMSVLEYPVRLDDKELKDEVMNELTILNEAWKQQLPPPVPEYEKADWRPKYCRFHKQCVNQEKYLTI